MNAHKIVQLASNDGSGAYPIKSEFKSNHSPSTWVPDKSRVILRGQNIDARTRLLEESVGKGMLQQLVCWDCPAICTHASWFRGNYVTVDQAREFGLIGPQLIEFSTG